MKTPAISVVMPVHNAAPYLSLCIESILKQTFTDFEFIIVDDGSTDDSPEIIRKYAAADARIHAIKNPQNLGATRSRNVGLDASRGKYVAVFDADDISKPERFKLQKEFLDTHPEIFLVGARPEVIDENGKVIRHPKVVTDLKRLLEIMPKANYFYHPSVMYRNDVSVRYREKILYAEDYDLLLNLLSSGKIITNMPETLIQYRIYGNSITDTKTLKQIFMAEKAQEMYALRVATSHDDYETFDPSEILSIDEEKILKDKKYLQMLIDATRKRRSVKKVRKYTFMYIRRFGLGSRNTKLFLLSLFPPLFRRVVNSK